MFKETESESAPEPTSGVAALLAKLRQSNQLYWVLVTWRDACQFDETSPLRSPPLQGGKIVRSAGLLVGNDPHQLLLAQSVEMAEQPLPDDEMEGAPWLLLPIEYVLHVAVWCAAVPTEESAPTTGEEIPPA